MEHVYRNVDQIVLGIPSKGRLKTHILEYLAEHGVVVQLKSERQLKGEVAGMPHIKVVFAHPKDIPLFLEKGVLDIGFTGLDLVYETRAKVRPVVKTGRGHMKMSLMVPDDKDQNHPFHLMDKTVGTPFPKIAHAYFAKLKVRVNICPIQGASEVMPYLGLVDGIVDVVETGKSAEENCLKIITDDIFDSECIAIVKDPECKENYKVVNEFLKRIY